MSDTKLFPKVGLQRSTKIVGCKIENPHGDDLGQIEDLVIDLAEGRVSAAIVSMGGFLGLGKKLTAIPITAFMIDESNEKFILDIDVETLKNAPTFNADEWPTLMDRVWAADIYAYFGYPPYWL